jgi:mannose-6-phosphate isomerase
MSMYRLRCAVQNYEWGKLGLESKVAQFARASFIDVKADTPYAEVSDVVLTHTFGT